VHHPRAWCCFAAVKALWPAWVFADCLHVVRNPGGRSVFRIVCRWIVLLVSIDIVIIALFVLISGILGLA